MIKLKSFPRFMICAPSSGSGKTLITCALLRILERKGYHPASFKCGPDYIDPMFHKKVLGIPGRNLDVFLMGHYGLRGALSRGAEGKDIGVLEGVMGFFDGMSTDSIEGSSADICSITGTPAILVVNCKGMSSSVIALIKGFCEYGRENYVKGVILNNVSLMVAGSLKKEIEKELGIPVIGFLPRLKNEPFSGRHLGLVMPDEIPQVLDIIDDVADRLSENLDFDKLMEIAADTKRILMLQDFDIPKEWKISGSKQKIRVGIAMDEAFCFYYEDNLELLRQMGAEIIPFSPVHDAHLPQVSRLILGGGYPELYAKALSENKSMREDILRAARGGMPVLAECGGFLYLQESLSDPEGKNFDMVGALKGNGNMRDKLHHFGYVTMSSTLDNPYLKVGEEIKAHEFHYYDTTDNGEVCLLKKPSGKSWCGYQVKEKVFGGFAHLYYPSCPEFVKRFLEC